MNFCISKREILVRKPLLVYPVQFSRIGNQRCNYVFMVVRAVTHSFSKKEASSSSTSSILGADFKFSGIALLSW